METLSKEQIVRAATSYAYNISDKKLFGSDCAVFVHGSKQRDEDWNYYSKSYHRNHGPKKWINPGAKQDGDKIIIDPARGKAFSIPCPPSNALYDADIQVSGDYYLTKNKGKNCFTRYDVIGIKTGVARLVRHKMVNDGIAYYEHGATFADIATEKKRKIKLAIEAAKRIQLEKKQRRKIDLIARLCDVDVTRDDIASTGACRAGIDGFIKRYGIVGDSIRSKKLLSFSDNRYITSGIRAAIVRQLGS